MSQLAGNSHNLLVGSPLFFHHRFVFDDFVRDMLNGLGGTDSVSIAAAVVLLTAAGYLPARRAARIDPPTALRFE